jgi:hypothetical protein
MTNNIPRKTKGHGKFFLDNKLVDDGFISVLGRSATAVYIALARHAHFITQKCFPSQKTLAREIGADKRTVARAIDKLVDHNLIHKIQIGKKCNNRYVLLDKDIWSSDMATPTSPDMACCVESPDDTGVTSTVNEIRRNEQRKDNETCPDNYRQPIGGGEWSSSVYISNLVKSTDPARKILGRYYREKQYVFPTKEAANDAVDRDIESAHRIRDYPLKDIKATIDHIKGLDYIKKWDLGTVNKFINELNQQYE